MTCVCILPDGLHAVTLQRCNPLPDGPSSTLASFLGNFYHESLGVKTTYTVLTLPFPAFDEFRYRIHLSETLDNRLVTKSRNLLRMRFGLGVRIR
ncbi:hypothetical protein TWF569_011955 [Orbilia oligospora]|nr:hypothetical protein TWF569_011955 [Orbilia oligospora]